MGEVVQLAKPPRKKYIRSLARECLSECLDQVGDAVGVVVVSIGRDGRFATRTTCEDGAMHLFDLYSRAGSIIDENRRQFVIDTTDE